MGLTSKDLNKIERDLDYPNVILSTVISFANPAVQLPISTIKRPGYVTLYAPAGNSGVIYIGCAGVGAANFALVADHSVAFEFADLSQVYVLPSVQTDVVHILGATK